MAWYEEFFAGEDPLRSEGYSESDASRGHVDFVIDKLGLTPGDRVLDLCCGQGRHLIDLMRRGFDVVGVDLSEYMLEKCRESASRQNLEPSLIQADMRTLDFDEEFDAVINMYTSFGYLENDEEDIKVIRGVARALKPGGRFLIDLINRDGLMRKFKERGWHENGRGDVIVSETHFNPLEDRLTSRELTLTPDGQRTERCMSLRIYTYTELEKMLKNSGLRAVSVYGGFDGSPYTIDSRRMTVVAEKTN